jgi:hypothetical protein
VLVVQVMPGPIVVLGATVVVVTANWHPLMPQKQMRRPPRYAVIMLDVGPPKKHMLLASIEGSLVVSALKNCVQVGHRGDQADVSKHVVEQRECNNLAHRQ